MQPAVIQAIRDWEEHWERTQQSAVAAMKTAFPLLADYPRYVGCDDIRMKYEKAGLGAGRVCLNDEGRISIEFNQVPNTVIAQATDEMNFPWLDNADGPLREALPGAYCYDCESTNAEFEFVLGAEEHGRVNVLFATAPDATAVLALLAEAAQVRA